MKKKLLIVVDHLMQHGVERYVFEICKAINRDKFEVCVFSLNPLSPHINYYGPLLESYGIKVDYLKVKPLKVSEKFNFLSKLFKKIKSNISLLNQKVGIKHEELELERVLLGYDIIAIMKIENFNKYPMIFSKFPNLVVHLLSGPVQYTLNPYRNLPPLEYKFSVMHEDQIRHVIETEFKDDVDINKFRFQKIPLFMNLNSNQCIYSGGREEYPIISVFSRISLDQPTIFFLFCFSLLLKRIPNARLLFFGAGYSEEIMNFFKLNCSIFQMENNVTFMGHVNNLEDAINKYEISLGWMNIDRDNIGYSSIETISMGLPTLFFDISIGSINNEISQLKIEDEIVSYKDIEDFVDCTFKILTDKNRRLHLSSLQRNYIQEKYGLNNEKILELETFYESASIN